MENKMENKKVKRIYVIDPCYNLSEMKEGYAILEADEEIAFELTGDKGDIDIIGIKNVIRDEFWVDSGQFIIVSEEDYKEYIRLRKETSEDENEWNDDAYEDVATALKRLAESHKIFRTSRYEPPEIHITEDALKQNKFPIYMVISVISCEIDAALLVVETNSGKKIRIMVSTTAYGDGTYYVRKCAGDIAQIETSRDVCLENYWFDDEEEEW